jgi:hypothetical protein
MPSLNREKKFTFPIKNSKNIHYLNKMGVKNERRSREDD